MATQSSILAWEIQGQRGLVGYSPWGHKELDTTEKVTLRPSSGRGAWWAAGHGIVKSPTRVT